MRHDSAIKNRFYRVWCRHQMGLWDGSWASQLLHDAYIPSQPNDMMVGLRTITGFDNLDMHG